MDKDRLQRYREAMAFVHTHRCSECGKMLNCNWESADFLPYFCMRDKSHQGFERIPEPKIPSYTELHDAGEAIPGHIAQQIERRRKKKMQEEYGNEKARALEPYRRSASLTQAQATEILRTIWPKAPMVEVVKAAILCRDFGLNPLMKHVFLIPFRNTETGGITWETILGINATRTLARRANPFGYEDGPRVMTEAEQEQINGRVDNDRIWAKTVVVDLRGLKAPGYGSWPRAVKPHATNKGNTAENMAMVRSERAALMRLCPAEMGAGLAALDVVDERYINGEIVAEALAEPETIERESASGSAKQSDRQKLLMEIKAEAERIGLNPREEHDRRFPDKPTLEQLQQWLAELKTLPVGDEPESPQDEPHDMTWEEFWAAAATITGKTPEQTAGMLGVKNMDDWTETLDEALEQLRRLCRKA